VRLASACRKRLEDVRQELAFDAAAVIGHRQPRHLLDPPQGYVDAPAAVAELGGVGDQIPDHLLQPVGITLQDSAPTGRVDRDGNLFGIRPRAWSVAMASSMTGWQIDRPCLQAELAGHDAGDVEDVLDQPGLSGVLRSMASSASSWVS